MYALAIVGTLEHPCRPFGQHYADTKKVHATPEQLSIEQIDSPFVTTFLNDLESSRGVSARTWNLRLTAIRSFFRFASYELPSSSVQIQRVLTLPRKKYTR